MPSSATENQRFRGGRCRACDPKFGLRGRSSIEASDSASTLVRLVGRGSHAKSKEAREELVLARGSATDVALRRLIESLRLKEGRPESVLVRGIACLMFRDVESILLTGTISPVGHGGAGSESRRISGGTLGASFGL
jgi:hypothetical protein